MHLHKYKTIKKWAFQTDVKDDVKTIYCIAFHELKECERCGKRKFVIVNVEEFSSEKYRDQVLLDLYSTEDYLEPKQPKKENIYVGIK